MKKQLQLSMAFFVLCASIQHSFGQEKKKEQPRLTFGRYTLMYLTGTEQRPPNPKSSLGHGLGLEILLNAPYNQFEGDEKFILGWNWDNRIGWNFTNKQLCSFGEYIGIWGKHLIGKNMEAGFQYSFLGYNVYQNISFLGSKIQAGFRWKNLQFTYGREGSGAFYGAISTRYKDDMTNVNSFELAFLESKKLWCASIRQVSYTFGTNHTNETMFSLGKAF